MRWLSDSSICIYNMCSFVTATYSSCPSTSVYMMRPSHGSVPPYEEREGVVWEIAGEVREIGRGPSAVMNTGSNSRLSQRRMSHLARHCAVNETEWGGMPAERGCRVCERGLKALHTHWGCKRKQTNSKHMMSTYSQVTYTYTSYTSFQNHCGCVRRQKYKNFITLKILMDLTVLANPPDFPLRTYCILLCPLQVSSQSHISHDLWQIFSGEYFSPSTLKVYCFHPDNYTATPNDVSLKACEAEGSY